MTPAKPGVWGLRRLWGGGGGTPRVDEVEGYRATVYDISGVRLQFTVRCPSRPLVHASAHAVSGR